LPYSACYGLQQIKLLKADIITRNTRQAVEKSIEYMDKFANKLIPLQSEYHIFLKEKGISKSIGPVDFTEKKELISLKPEILKIKLSYPNLNNYVNELELLAAAINSGLADKDLAFQPMGRAFCKMVEQVYDIICLSRSRNKTNMYANISTLYTSWKELINQNDLICEKNEIEKSLACLSTQPQKPFIGQEI